MSTLGKRVKDALFDNFWLKLLSLIFALGFYASIHSAQNTQRTLQVPVVAALPPPDAEERFQLMSHLPEKVTVTVRGSQQQLDTLRGDEIDPIQLDLRVPQNFPKRPIDGSLITGLPPRVEVVSVTPSWIEIRWEKVVKRQVPLRVERIGEPAQGMEYRGAPKIVPAEVEAEGPESLVKVIQYASTQPFDGRGLGEGSHTRTLALENPPDQVRFEPQSVEVTETIAPQQAVRVFEDLAVEVLGLPRATTRPRTVSVRVSGLPDDVNPLVAERIVPTVDLKKMTDLDLTQPGSAELPVTIDIPNVALEVTPATVIVKW